MILGEWEAEEKPFVPAGRMVGGGLNTLTGVRTVSTHKPSGSTTNFP